ncbi:MAG: cation:proton antiporter [Methanomassiliicoccales archaeon]|nr:cation:proton antiporter [Methanomassiliicoccales archaeon]
MDTTTQYMLEIALITIIAGACSVIFTKLRFPSVIGYIVAGMLLGPTILGSIVFFDVAIIDFLGNIGIALLMFSIGLEFNLRRLRKIGGFAILAGGVEVLLMLLTGYWLGQSLGLGDVESVFLAAIMAISSTAVIVKVLQDTGKMKEEWVEPVIGVLIVEDLAGVILLTLTSPLLTGQNPNIGSTLGIMLAIVAFIAFSLVLGLAVVPAFINRIARRFSSETLLLVSLGMAFGFALVAVGLGLSLTIGAFIMGVLISQSKHVDEVVHKIEPIKEMFMAVFFVSVGMLVDPVLVLQGIGLALVIALVFYLGKTFFVALGCYAANLPARTAFLAGASMVAIGEVSFVIANSGVQAGIISLEVYSSIIGAAIISMVLLPVSIRSGPKEFDWLVRHLPKPIVRSIKAIEGVRMQLRSRLSTSAQRREEINRQLFWLLIDVTLFVCIQFFGLLLLLASQQVRDFAAALGLGVSAVALVLSVAMALPVILDMISRVRKIVALMAFVVTGSKTYQAASATAAFRIFKRLVRVLVAVILIFTLVPFAFFADEYATVFVLVFLGMGLLLGYLIWDVLRAGYTKWSSALEKGFIEDEE